MVHVVAPSFVSVVSQGDASHVLELGFNVRSRTSLGPLPAPDGLVAEHAPKHRASSDWPKTRR